MASLTAVLTYTRALKPEECFAYLVYDKEKGRYWFKRASGREFHCYTLSRDEAVTLYRKGVPSKSFAQEEEETEAATERALEAAKAARVAKEAKQAARVVRKAGQEGTDH